MCPIGTPLSRHEPMMRLQLARAISHSAANFVSQSRLSGTQSGSMNMMPVALDHPQSSSHRGTLWRICRAIMFRASGPPTAWGSVPVHDMSKRRPTAFMEGVSMCSQSKRATRRTTQSLRRSGSISPISLHSSDARSRSPEW